jgi:8-oxo-dGTP pyrophosphatase MutT (NUDIX family)
MKPKVTESESLLQTPYFGIKRERLQWPGGFEHDMYFMEAGQPYVIVIVIRDRRILLVNQYRHASECQSIEFPMGVVEPDETIEVAAARELEEETGMRAGSLVCPGSFFPSIGRQRSRGFVFLASDITQGVRKLDEAEVDLKAEWLYLSDWKDAIREGRVIAGDTLAAWSLYLMKKDVAP